MKKKFICAMAFCLSAALASPFTAFADTGETGAAATGGGAPKAIVSDMTFATPAIQLTLKDAYKKLETSPTMEVIRLQNQGDDAVSKGYTESVQSLSRMENDPKYTWSYDSSNKAMAKANRDFANSVLEPNKQARVNKFNRDTFEHYYSLKNGEAMAAIAKENLAIKEALLKTANLKFKAGTVAKMDVLTAEIDAKSAGDAYLEALNGPRGLNTGKMGFNTYMGYDLMQGLSLTDPLTEVALPAISLADSIKSALANRLELKEAAFSQQMAQLSFDNVKAYPSSSATYIKAKIALAQATLLNSTTPDTIEADVRTKYMNMMLTHQQVQTGKQNVEKAKETARLAQLQYDAGVLTLTDVQNAQLGSFKTQQDYASALLEYNLAVEDYKLCSGVGTAPAALAGGGA